jgi:hypothetical protein
MFLIRILLLEDNILSVIYEFYDKLYFFSGLLGFKADNNSTNIEIGEKVLASTPNAQELSLILERKKEIKKKWENL